MVQTFETLKEHHNTKQFSCESEPITRWLRTIAMQHMRKGLSTTYVLTDSIFPDVIQGFYALTVSEAHANDIPIEYAKKLPNKIPVIVIGRLARDKSMQGKGIGEPLLLDAMAKSIRVADMIGVALLVVHAKDSKAADFYRRYEFQPFPDDPLNLALPIATARRALSGQG